MAGFFTLESPFRTGPPSPQSALAAGLCLRSDHPSETPLPGWEGGGRRVVAAGEGEEGVRPVRGVIVPGPVLPHPPALVPLLPVRPKPTQPKIAALLVELAAGKGRPRRRDRLE